MFFISTFCIMKYFKPLIKSLLNLVFKEYSCCHTREHQEKQWQELEQRGKNTSCLGMTDVLGWQCSLNYHLICTPVPNWTKTRKILGINKFTRKIPIKYIDSLFSIEKWKIFSIWTIILHTLHFFFLVKAENIIDSWNLNVKYFETNKLYKNVI